jgi:hypothetical protein
MPGMKLCRDLVISLLAGAGIWLAIAFGAVVLGDAMGGFRCGEAMILPDGYVLTDNRGGVGAVAAAVFLVAGALYAWLLLGRFSPSGPRLVGGLFLSAGVWAACSPATYDAIVGQPPAWGYTIVLAAPLLIPVDRRPARCRSGLLLGAGIWLAIGAGDRLFVKAVGVHAKGESIVLGHETLGYGVGSVLVLLAAGVLVAVVLRAGPSSVVVGLSFAGLSIWALTDVVAVEGWAPLAAAPLWGYALVLAVPMVAAFVSQEVRDTATLPRPVGRGRWPARGWSVLWWTVRGWRRRSRVVTGRVRRVARRVW